MGEKGKKTKELIKKQSKKIFAREGYKNVTMKDICEATSLSRGGLYRHYGSLEQIFEEILKDLGENQRNEFASKMEKGISAVTILEEVLSNMEEEMCDAENSLSLAFYEFSNEYNSDFMRKANQGAKEYWTDFIKYGVERKEFREVDVKEIVDLILYSYQGVRMWSRVMQLDRSVAKNITNHIKKCLI